MRKLTSSAALIANWKVWPLIQTINFKVMPLPYRVPFQSTCGIGWVLYLSLLNARCASLPHNDIVPDPS
jgi:protein Mpv17